MAGAITAPNINLTTTGANDITVDGNIGSGAVSTVNLNSGGAIVGGAGVIDAATVGLSASGAIGASGTEVQTSGTTTLTATSTNAGVFLSNTGSDISSFAASAGGAAGQVELTTDGSVTLGGNVSGPGGVTLTLGAGELLTVGGAHTITATNNPINISADDVALAGAAPKINAGNGTVTIRPVQNNTVINLAGGVGGLNLTETELQSISAGTLVIGSGAGTGGINLNGDLNLSGNNYGLQLLQGAAAFNAGGNTLTMGANPLTINVGGAANLGPIVTNGSTINVTGSSVSFNGAVGSATDTSSFTSTAGSISGASLITAQSLTLGAVGGSVGPLNTVVNNTINATAGGIATSSINITNTGSLTNFSAVSSGANGTVSLNNTGNVTLAGNVTGPAGVTLTLDAGSTLNVTGGNSVTANNATINLNADSLILTGQVNAGAASGNIIIVPVTSAQDVDLGGAGYLPGFGNLTAQNIQVGNTTSYTGNIIINIGVLNTASNLSFLSMAGGGGGFQNNGTINNPANSVTVNVSGNIDNAAAANIISNSLSLTSTNGSIGSVNPVNGSAPTLAFSAPNGSIAFNSTAAAATPVTINGSNSLTTFSVSGNTLQTAGVLSSGGAMTINAAQSLALNGTINTGGLTNFTGSTGLTSNAAVTANSGDINLNSANTININGSFNVKNGNFSATSTAANVNVNAGASTIASNNVTLTAAADLNFGSLAGAATTVSAGQSTTNALAVMPVGSIITNGNTQIAGGGNVTINDNVTILSHGGATAANTGDLSVQAGGNINVGMNNTMTAYGGFLWLSSGGNIKVGDNTQMASVGKLDDNGGTYTTGAGVPLPTYFGGALGVFAGGVAGGANAALTNLVNNSRSYTDQTIIGPGVVFDASSPNYSHSGGSIMQALNSSAALPPNVDPATGNKFTLQGGVIYVQQTGTSHLDLDPPTLIAIGPASPPPPSNSSAVLPPTSTTDTGSQSLGLPIVVREPGFVNTGVPTDRIWYNIQLDYSSQQAGQGLSVGDRRSWFVAEGPSQPFVLEDDNDTVIVGQEGSKLALIDSRQLVVDLGRLAILVGSKNDLSVETSLGVVNIPKGSVVLVDSTNPEIVRVTNLSGASVQMLITFNDAKTPMSIASGEELVVAKSGADIKAGDQLSRVNLPLSTTVAGLSLQKNSIDRKQVVENERLLSCGQDSDCLTKRRVDLLKASLGSSKGSTSGAGSGSSGSDKPGPGNSGPANSGKNNSGSNSSVGSPKSMEILNNRRKQAKLLESLKTLKPVAFSSSSGATRALLGRLSSLRTEMAVIKHRGAEMELKGDKVNLLRGEALVIADKKTVVITGDSHIVIDVGTIALISTDSLVTKVRNVWEPKRGSLRQFVGKNHVDVGAGQESLLAKDEKTINTVVSSDLVGRRRVRHVKLENKQVSTSEVSLITLMASSPVLNALVKSEQDQDAYLTSKMLKMAACIQAVTGSHGNYTTRHHR